MMRPGWTSLLRSRLKIVSSAVCRLVEVCRWMTRLSGCRNDSATALSNLSPTDSVRIESSKKAGSVKIRQGSAGLLCLPQQLNLQRLSQPGLKSSDRPPALADQLVEKCRVVVQPKQIADHVNVDVRS